MEHPLLKPARDLPGPFARTGVSKGLCLEQTTHQGIAPAFVEAPAAPDDAEAVVRLTVRICVLLRDAKRLSWVAPEVRTQVEALVTDLEGLAASGSVRLDVEPRALALADERFVDPPKAVRQLIAMFRRKRLAAVTFGRGISPYEIVVLLQLLQSTSETIDPHDAEALQTIELHEERAEPLAVAGIVLPRPMRPDPLDPPDGDLEVRDLVREITGAIDSISVSTTPVGDARRPRGSGLLELVDQLGHNAEIALILSSLRRHDEYTYDHSINVGLLSICLARHVGWRGRDLQEFGIAALIHDVGKLYTPLEILNKPGRLTPQEWVVMKRHPRDGHDILREAGVGSHVAPRIALEHHTRPDGVGYPPLPYGVDRMHPGSQMVKIADTYDAFTTIRPYRSQTRPTEALKMLRKQAGTHFDGELVEAFCEMMGEYPIGSTLQLRSGRIALVVDVHPDAPARPLVRLLRRADGKQVRKLELVDLRATEPGTDTYLDDAVETIDPVIRNIPIGRYV